MDIMSQIITGTIIDLKPFGLKVKKKILLNGKQEEKKIYLRLILISLIKTGQRTQKEDS